METLDHGPSRNRGVNEERVGEVVDPGLLLQSSKFQQVWVEGLGDLAIFELLKMEERESGRAELLEVGGGVFIPLPQF